MPENELKEVPANVTPILPEGKNFKGQYLIIEPNTIVEREYSTLPHHSRIFVERGILFIHEDQVVVRKVLAGRYFDVKADYLYTFGAGDDGASVTETYRK